MSKHDFGYFFHEGLSNMFSHGFMSFAAIGITVACLLIMGTFTLVAVNADANLKQVEQDNEILAFVDDTYTEAQAKALQKKAGSGGQCGVRHLYLPGGGHAVLHQRTPG